MVGGLTDEQEEYNVVNRSLDGKSGSSAITSRLTDDGRHRSDRLTPVSGVKAKVKYSVTGEELTTAPGQIPESCPKVLLGPPNQPGRYLMVEQQDGQLRLVVVVPVPEVTVGVGFGPSVLAAGIPRISITVTLVAIRSPSCQAR